MDWRANASAGDEHFALFLTSQKILLIWSEFCGLFFSLGQESTVVGWGCSMCVYLKANQNENTWNKVVKHFIETSNSPRSEKDGRAG